MGSYPTVSPLPRPAETGGAVCFLWPFPSPCGAQALPGSLPGGARTFLGPEPATIALDQRLKYSGFTPYPACPTRANPRSAWTLSSVLALGVRTFLPPS